ncbi:MAG TPA: NnrU family protein [Polyangiaceae bacterium]|nr:NnrU family protein [Polyangiaceae bacterium]
MSDPFARLVLAATVWFLIHPAVAGSSLRGRLVARLGEGPFRGLFAALSLASLTFLVMAYRAAPCEPLWITPRALLRLPATVMPVAFTLFAGAFTVPNPTAVGAERVLAAESVARGALRVTRHPFLWAVALWSGSHLIVNGNLASLWFFGSLCLTALVGTRDIDRKRQRSQPENFARYRAVTSNFPFAAIVAGRNQLVLRELLLPASIGVALTALLLTFHQRLFHVSPLP